MLQRCIFISLLLLVSANLGWGDGEVYSILRDPRTGVVLPLKPTPVRVERQKLEVTLVAHAEARAVEFDIRNEVAFEYRVMSTYWLHNPTDQEQVLKIAFPIPNEVVLREPPVWLDGSMVKWQLLDDTDFLELHRLEMHREFGKILGKCKTLRTVLQVALKEMEPIRNRTSLEGLLPPEFPLSYDQLKAYEKGLWKELKFRGSLLYELRLFWEAYLDLKGKWRCPIWRLFWVVHKYTGYKPNLLRDWAISDWFLVPATGELVKRSGSEKEWWEPGWEEQFRFNILLFEVRLKPKGQHTLTIRYQQPAGVAWYEGSSEGFHIPGLHFTYVLKVRRSWGYFGSIDVRVRIPEYLRLRSVPPLRFVGVDRGYRVYEATLKPYRYNLYIVAGNSETFQPRIVLGDDDIKPGIIGRFWESYAFVPIREWFWKYVYYGASPTTWNGNDKTVTIHCSKGIHAFLKVGQKTVVVHGKEIELPAPVQFFKDKVWVPVKGLGAIMGECFGFAIERVFFDPKTGRVKVKLAQPSNEKRGFR